MPDAVSPTADMPHTRHPTPLWFDRYAVRPALTCQTERAHEAALDSDCDHSRSDMDTD
ncbi:hypothetical protein KXX11_006557, partial [Aspergillus fumigatus]